jgi:uncharacterized protein
MPTGLRTCILLLGAAMVSTACQRSPDLVIDAAQVFDPGQEQRLELFHGLLLQDHDIDYRVMTVAEAPDISALAITLYGEYAVGSASARAYGLLLLVDAASQTVRLEVGYGLEGFYPDAFVAYIENRQMLPFFEAERVSDGILATTELIVDRAQRYALGETALDESWLSGTGGGGATARVGQHALPDSPAPAGPGHPARSPEETLAQYLEAMANRNDDPSLTIYTPQTRTMLRDWVMTPAQMDNLVSSYRRCQPQAARYDQAVQLAVIRYPIPQRRCAPWFFRRNGEFWELDLTMMSRAVRFGRDNSWHFSRGVRHPYEFAFADWHFDGNGFPLD